jgi:hypothetical protein
VRKISVFETLSNRYQLFALTERNLYIGLTPKGVKIASSGLIFNSYIRPG